MSKLIWSSEIRLKDWKDYLEEEYPDVKDKSQKYKLCSELNNVYLQDERKNLNIKTEGKILAIADLGLWNGHRSGYNILNNNIRDILSTECDDAKWFYDGHNIKFEGRHHDGTNYVLYREIRKDKNVDKFLEKIYNNEKITPRMINYYTKSIAPYVKEVYGW